MRGLQKKAKDLRLEMRTLRRLSQAQAVAVREDIKDAFMGIRATLMAGSGSYWGQGDQEKTRMSRDEELYKQEVIRLEKDLGDLESSVEGLRGEVINRRTRVNMAAVEDMALVLSRARWVNFFYYCFLKLQFFFFRMICFCKFSQVPKKIHPTNSGSRF